MPTEAEIWAALDEVIHPTYGMSLIALQMVRAVRIAPDQIEVDLVMNCPGCPAGQVVLAKARQVVESVCPPGRPRVTISLLPLQWSLPWQSLIREL